MKNGRIQIADRVVGAGSPCLVIAEAGVNHNGDKDTAMALVDAAAGAGADAVKFQTFRTDSLVTRWAPKAAYQRKTTRESESQYEMLRRLELPGGVYRELASHCRDLGILFLSTPFDAQSADLLQEIGVPAFKVPSGEVTNLPLLRHIGSKGKPVILSTGMADIGEVSRAVETLEEAGSRDMVILHCVSSYPAQPDEMNLRAMDTLRQAFGYPVGLSDHTLGFEISLAAVALGAAVLEKHFTLDRNLPGPDHGASLEPEELASMVKAVRKVEAALGSGLKEPSAAERDTARSVRKSLVAAQFIAAGTILEGDMIAVRRPGTGLPPARLPDLIGRKALVDIQEGQLLAEEMVQ
ncbi:MAG: N-acetylneuraminate synthase [bacterium]|nr:MAG: N-acetylneuraminate synthase [bacterium]